MKNKKIIFILNDSEIISDNEFWIMNSADHYSFTLSIILLLMFIFGIIFNIISIIHLLKCKKLQAINILIINLAVADLLYIMGKYVFTKNELFSYKYNKMCYLIIKEFHCL